MKRSTQTAPPNDKRALKYLADAERGGRDVSGQGVMDALGVDSQELEDILARLCELGLIESTGLIQKRS